MRLLVKTEDFDKMRFFCKTCILGSENALFAEFACISFYQIVAQYIKIESQK